MDIEGYGKVVWHEQGKDKLIVGNYVITDDFVEVTTSEGIKKILGRRYIVKIDPI